MRFLRRPVGRGRPQRGVQGAGQPVVGFVAPHAALLSAGRFTVVVFDLDGTLLDSDAALAAPYVALGVAPEDVTFGHVVAEECERLGLSVDDYLDRYDVTAAPAYPGVDKVVGALARWAVCSNKVGRFGRVELDRLGWQPEAAHFAEEFGGGPKRLAPVLDALGRPAPDDVVYVGDTAHDRACAHEAGVRFALAAWNPRTAGLALASDLILHRPTDVLSLVSRDAQTR